MSELHSTSSIRAMWFHAGTSICARIACSHPSAKLVGVERVKLATASAIVRFKPRSAGIFPLLGVGPVLLFGVFFLDPCIKGEALPLHGVQVIGRDRQLFLLC